MFNLFRNFAVRSLFDVDNLRLLRSNVWNIDEVFWSGKLHEFNLFLFCDVCSLDVEAHAMVEVDCLIIVCTDVQAQMRGILCEQVLQQFSSDALSLATRPYANAHKVGALRYLNVMLLLELPLLLYVLFASILNEKGRVADDSLSVLLTSHDNLVDIRFPKGLDNHARIAVLIESVPINLAERPEVFWLILFSLLDDFNHNLLTLSLRSGRKH